MEGRYTSCNYHTIFPLSFHSIDFENEVNYLEKISTKHQRQTPSDFFSSSISKINK